MAKKIQRTLNQDPRYLNYASAYRMNPLAFLRDELGIDPSTQQTEIVEAMTPEGAKVSVSSGHGCFGLGTEIMLSTGDIKPVEDIVVGDKLMGDDGKSHRNVLELKRDKQEMYRFTYRDGTSHVFNKSHILCLVATNTKGTRIAGNKITVTVGEWLRWGEDRKRCHAIYRHGVEEFSGSKSELPIPPYILGAWLGDGTAGTTNITSEDEEIAQEFIDYCKSIDGRMRYISQRGNAAVFGIKGKTRKHRANTMLTGLQDLNLQNNKHIPDIYLKASRQDRLELLAGLLDTDGHLDKRGGSSFDFIQKSQDIAEKTAWIARSVGCHSTIRKVTKRGTNIDFEGEYYRVTIGRNIDQIPTRITRKKAPSANRQRRNLHFGIKSVEPLGVDNYYGFELDGNRKFLGGDFTVLHNTGKGFIAAGLAIHFLVCHPESLVMLTANNIDQVQKVIFKYIRQHWRKYEEKTPWVADYFSLTNTMLYETVSKDSWAVFGKTASRGNEEGLAGQHAKDYMIMVDEASGVSDKAFDTIWGICTQENNKILLMSQYTRPSGHFSESQTNLAIAEGNKDGLYHPIILNSEESPHVTLQAIKGFIKRFGGRDTPEYGIRVLGICPDNAEGFLIPRSMAAKGFDYKVNHIDDYGYLGLVDVATDGYRDKSEVTIVKVSGYGDKRIVETVFRWTAPVGVDGAELAIELKSMTPSYSNITWVIDAGGYGKITVQKAEKAGLNVTPINWGKRPHSNELKDQYFNERSYSAVMLRNALRDGKISLLANSVKDRNLTLDQFSKIPYSFDENAKWKLWSKDKMRNEGIKSPDIFDSHCFAWLSDYIPANDESYDGGDDDWASDMLDLDVA